MLSQNKTIFLFVWSEHEDHFQRQRAPVHLVVWACVRVQVREVSEGTNAALHKDGKKIHTACAANTQYSSGADQPVAL